jgi:pimeloyl-ACP methyl ester carboxylesterase/DNA-binding CsgD family transcriptional regulator
MLMPRDPTVLANEIRFAHVSSGARIAWAKSGRGPALVRVAHWMTNVEHDLRSPMWGPWLAQMGRSLQVIRYDERGCGSSGQDDVALGLDAAVEELAAVIEASGEPRVALLGQSGAAAPAIAYAVKHPDRVSHLVLLGGYLRGLIAAAPGGDAAAFLEAKIRLVELGWGTSDPAVRQFFTTSFIPDASREIAQVFNEQQRLSCDGARAARIMRARAMLDVAALASHVRCPTLVLHASGDLVVPAERGRELAAAIPGARFEMLASNNHIPIPGEIAFDRFCEAVTAFVVAPAPAPKLKLTPREGELAQAVALGLDNLQIAARLGVADKTARNALSALYAKLGVEGRPQAIVALREQGFGS